MADYKHIINFIKREEGGLSKNINDSASSNPVPDGSGYHTNKGITWTTWSKVFGTTSDSIKKFYVMSDDDWGVIYKPLYWDVMLGDNINSQKIADIIVDWVWNSGKHYPEAEVQDVLIHAFGEHISEDGNFGPATIEAINSANEEQLWDAIIAKRHWYVNQIVVVHPSNVKFLKGWENRINSLVKFEETGNII